MRAESGSSTETTLDVGVAAHNEAPRIARAIRSLLAQELPKGFRWGSFRVVASGCTDGTAEAARAVDPRVQVFEESERRGKSAALAQLMEKCDAPFLVLLNADAVARPGAVAELLRAVRHDAAPFAASARPILRSGEPPGVFGRSVRLLWRIHHQFQRWAAVHGRLTTISDELLLLSGKELPPIREGIVNDGGFIATWLTGLGRQPRYVPDAIVEIEPAPDLATYVRQRRRILAGLDQTRSITGVRSATAESVVLTHPAEVVHMVSRAMREEPGGQPYALLALAVAESAAWILARWDRLRRRAAPAVWVRRPS